MASSARHAHPVIKRRRTSILLTMAGVLVVTAVLLLAGCAKSLEPYKDASVSDTNTSAAVTGSMPDGFSNWARKCDGPNMVYVVYHGDNPYGAIAVVPNDPRCKG